MGDELLRSHLSKHEAAHPGYLGSLLCLNGTALASGNLITLLASLAATAAAYGYRIRTEDEMLIAALGPSYAEYRSQVRALLPSFRTHLS